MKKTNYLKPVVETITVAATGYLCSGSGDSDSIGDTKRENYQDDDIGIDYGGLDAQSKQGVATPQGWSGWED